MKIGQCVEQLLQKFRAYFLWGHSVGDTSNPAVITHSDIWHCSDGIFDNYFIWNILESVTLKLFWKSVRILAKLQQTRRSALLTHGVCLCGTRKPS